MRILRTQHNGNPRRTIIQESVDIVTECCREGKKDKEGLGQWETTGDPTENCLNRCGGETWIIMDRGVNGGEKVEKERVVTRKRELG